VRIFTPARLVIAGVALLVVVLALWTLPSRDYIFLPDDAHPVAPLVDVRGGKDPADGSGIYYEEGFDPDGCRMEERMWRASDEGGSLTQSLRCYAPADLRLLLEATDLSLVAIEPYEDETYEHLVPLFEAMLYLGKLEREPSLHVPRSSG